MSRVSLRSTRATAQCPSPIGRRWPAEPDEGRALAQKLDAGSLYRSSPPRADLLRIRIAPDSDSESQITLAWDASRTNCNNLFRRAVGDPGDGLQTQSVCASARIFSTFWSFGVFRSEKLIWTSLCPLTKNSEATPVLVVA